MTFLLMSVNNLTIILTKSDLNQNNIILGAKDNDANTVWQLKVYVFLFTTWQLLTAISLISDGDIAELMKCCLLKSTFLQ